MTSVRDDYKLPVTTEGRMIASVLMTAGVGMFGSFTGLIASWILKPGKKDQEQDSELARLREQVEAIQRQLAAGSATSVDTGTAHSADLAELLAAWPELPMHVRAGILAEVGRRRGEAA